MAAFGGGIVFYMFCFFGGIIFTKVKVMKTQHIMSLISFVSSESNGKPKSDTKGRF